MFKLELWMRDLTNTKRDNSTKKFDIKVINIQSEVKKKFQEQ